MSLLSKQTLYLRISEKRLCICHVESGRQFGDEPVLALRQRGETKRIVAVGLEARSLGDSLQISLVNGFAHPRTLLADFAVAQKTLCYFIARVLPHRWLRPSFNLILHPLEKLDGGLTQIELRAWYELGKGCGARQVRIWTGYPLSAHELKGGLFPAELGQLHELGQPAADLPLA